MKRFLLALALAITVAVPALFQVAYAGDDPKNSDAAREVLYTLVKRWNYHHQESATWEFQWEDQWGGRNWWCVAKGCDCRKWNWVATYRDRGRPNDDPFPAANTSEYGDALVRSAALQQGITLPPELGLPTFELEVIEQE